MANVSGKLLN